MKGIDDAHPFFEDNSTHSCMYNTQPNNTQLSFYVLHAQHLLVMQLNGAVVYPNEALIQYSINLID